MDTRPRASAALTQPAKVATASATCFHLATSRE